MPRPVADFGRYSAVHVSRRDIAHSSVERTNRRPVFSLAAALLLLIPTLLLSCGDNPAGPTPPSPEAPRPVSVRVLPASATLSALDATVQLTADVRDQNGNSMAAATVEWTSSADSVAVVGTAGLARAADNGEATITASAGTVSGTAAITVKQVTSTVSVSPFADTLVVGDTVRLAAEAFDENGHAVRGAVSSWSSSDSAVAAVDTRGLVTALSPGHAVISAASGPATGNMELVVTAPLPTAIKITPTMVALAALGDTVRLAAEVRDQRGRVIEGAAALWSSLDEAVVAVDSAGLVTAVGGGMTRVAATAGESVGTAAVSVMQEAGSVYVSPEADTLAPGETLRLTADAFDANGHEIEEPRLSWWSSDSAVATVDTLGLVKAIGRGETRIVATVGDVSGEARVTVRARAHQVAVAPPADTIAPGDTLRLAAAAYDANGHAIDDAGFVWSSSDPSVVEVDSLGLVLGVGEGAAAVTVATFGASGESEITVFSPDRSALAALFEATGGPAWRRADNWLTDAPLDEWWGISTKGGRVTSLWIDFNNLTGSIPPDLGRLAHLELLNLVGNSLTGPIPRELGRLANLRSLSLSQNSLTGPIPQELGRLANLGSMWLTLNSLTGPIPPELGALVNLEELRLGHNELTGSVPPELGRLVNLEVLRLRLNSLTGPIPPELGALVNLNELILYRNSLAGPIPSELGQLVNLEELNLSWNSLTGPIPPELEGLANLRKLDLDHNDLTGSIPPELGRLANLEHLDLGSTDLAGPIPPELGDLANLRLLYLTFTNLTAIPGDLGKLANLEGFYMQFAPVSSPIPPELGNLSRLKILSLGFHPTLTGKIPPELGKLANLEELNLSWGSLTGPIPPELGKLGSLIDLQLQGNQLTGSIPPQLGNLTNLEEMDLGRNELTGSLPPELGRLTRLHKMLLGHNRLTSIPQGIGGMESLRRLDLGGNRLTSEGLPPGVFSGLPSLESLVLADNELSELPEGMFLGLPRLSLLSLGGNPGVPFTLMLEAIRTDGEDASAASPARMAVRLGEGAPVDLRIPLSAHGGEISADAAVLAAGSGRSAEVTVTRRAGGRGGAEVVAGPLPTLPGTFSGLRLESAGSLVLFGSVSNRAPVPIRSLPWMRMREGDEPREIPVSSYFDDPDGDGLAYSAVSADAGAVSVSVANDRLTVTPLAMGSTKIVVTATDEAGLAAESSFPVSVRGVREGSYAIDLIMTDRPGGVVEAAFDDAVEYWESILANTELPDVPVGSGVALGCQGVTSDQSLEVIDDLAIVASVGEVDGQGGVLGWAALCAIREESHLPLIGALRFDSEDLEVLRESDAMEEVILHEIGHLLGFGSVWDEQGLLINPSLPDSLGTDTHFRGPLAIAAFDEAGGDIYTGGARVPVENYAGRGSGDAHWRESVFDHELMTPRLNLGVPNPLSATTVQSLADMGYTVDARLAEPFRLPGAAAAARDQEARKIEYGDDVRPGPIMVFDRDGRVVRIVSS